MRFEIETGIPLPPPPRATGRPAKYPLLLMRPGDSFFVEDGRVVRRIRMAISSLKKRGRLTSDVKFTVRKTADGYRCWRVK